jgi:hypothetical protein
MHAWSSRVSGLWQAVLFVLFASAAIGPHSLWDEDR